MTDNNELSAIESKAGEILKGHNGVYLDKRLYTVLKKGFPGLTRKDFNKVLDSLLTSGYSMERGLIRPLTANEVEKQQKEEHESGKKAGKGASERPRLSTKRGI
ncbi:hypothetical protein [Methanobacterium sp. SMA-27]|uniref:hypothetical protein n=1 Tax=Methanobacterium sp. SMA-27 TaxID=1495336 RepID=UPI00064FBC5B|nr:hypothetical protein [Methanobacterium sp. SMA-27]